MIKNMTNEEWIEYTEEEGEMFMSLTNGLSDFWGVTRDGIDSNGIRMELGSGAHILRRLKKAIEIVQPKNILEIGTNVGYGTAMLLGLSRATVISIDISDRQETLDSANVLKDRYGERFDFYVRSLMGWKRNWFYDLCFIDGGHDEENATKDIEVCIEMKIPYLLFDDVEFQESVQMAISKFPQLELIEDMYNLKLYKNNQ